MSFPKYASTRRWCSDGIAEVPEHWVERRLRDVARVVNGFPFDSSLFTPDTGLPLVRIRDLGRDTTEMRYAGDIVTAALIDSTDVLIGMDGDFSVGRWLGSGRALLNQRVCCVRGRSPMITRFVEYHLPRPLQAINDVTYSTTVKHLSSGQVESIRIVMPPLDAEIASVVHFLDRETAKIDALIAEQERLIALLQEKRQAVISHVVTKGLNLNVPMKDSGVEWIGLIPAHWSVLTLRQVGSLLKGRGGSKRDASDEGVQCVRYGDLYTTHTYHINSSRGRIPLSVADGYFEMRRGDVLFAASGEDMADIGKSAVNLIAEQAYCGGDLVVLRPSIQLDAHFSGYAFDAHYAKAQKASLGRGTTVKHIYPDELGRVAVAIPPHNEQQAIAAFVSNELERIEVLRANSIQTIALLRERRTALITAAVTGQIDVRGLVETAA